MRILATDIRYAALVSLLLVLPLLTLELLFNQSTSWGTDSVVLYGSLYLLAVSLVLALIVVARIARARESAFKMLAGAVMLGVLGFVLGSLVIDQMPCFLGVPNCD